MGSGAHSAVCAVVGWGVASTLELFVLPELEFRGTIAAVWPHIRVCRPTTQSCLFRTWATCKRSGWLRRLCALFSCNHLLRGCVALESEKLSSVNAAQKLRCRHVCVCRRLSNHLQHWSELRYAGLRRVHRRAAGYLEGEDYSVLLTGNIRATACRIGVG